MRLNYLSANDYTTKNIYTTIIWIVLKHVTFVHEHCRVHSGKKNNYFAGMPQIGGAGGAKNIFFEQKNKSGLKFLSFVPIIIAEEPIHYLPAGAPGIRQGVDRGDAAKAKEREICR